MAASVNTQPLLTLLLGATARLVLVSLAAIAVLSAGAVAAGGSWELLVENAGISAMHAGVSHHNTVILLDRTNIGPSRISLPEGVCRDNPADRRSKHDCTAHSVLLELGSNRIRPLNVFTDTWCSSGQFTADGNLVQTGGDADGVRKIRYLDGCAARCDWVESSSAQLRDPRWYASNQVLPAGDRQIVVGGRGVFTWELVPGGGGNDGGTAVDLPFLRETEDPAQGDNLYPFVHLLPSGTLFIFANTGSIEYDYRARAVVRRYPRLPGGPRNYPSAGSSALLPLRPDPAGRYTRAEVLVCGGAARGAYSGRNVRAPASQTCGRIVASDPDPAWEVFDMPARRVMGDMVLLPTADVCVINGAQAGSQGWGYASQPALTPAVYEPGARAWRLQAPAAVPRMYHSVAVLLPDARLLLAGSNTHELYTFSGAFPTELRIEAFSPDYLDGDAARRRPAVLGSPAGSFTYGQAFTVTLRLAAAGADAALQLSLVSAPFVTHSFAQGQRLVSLPVTSVVQAGAGAGAGAVVVTTVAPPNGNVAPAGYYMLFAVAQGVPSTAVWLHLVV